MLLICVSMIAWSDGKPEIGEGKAAQFWKLRVPVLSLLESSPMNADLPKMMKSFVIFSSSCVTQSQQSQRRSVACVVRRAGMWRTGHH